MRNGQVPTAIYIYFIIIIDQCIWTNKAMWKIRYVYICCIILPGLLLSLQYHSSLVDIDECHDNDHPHNCVLPRGVCVDLTPFFRCDCSDGFYEVNGKCIGMCEKTFLNDLAQNHCILHDIQSLKKLPYLYGCILLTLLCQICYKFNFTSW